jgi:hypothetical protein
MKGYYGTFSGTYPYIFRKPPLILILVYQSSITAEFSAASNTYVTLSTFTSKQFNISDQWTFGLIMRQSFRKADRLWIFRINLEGTIKVCRIIQPVMDMEQFRIWRGLAVTGKL